MGFQILRIRSRVQTNLPPSFKFGEGVHVRALNICYDCCWPCPYRRRSCRPQYRRVLLMPVRLSTTRAPPLAHMLIQYTLKPPCAVHAKTKVYWRLRIRTSKVQLLPLATAATVLPRLARFGGEPPVLPGGHGCARAVNRGIPSANTRYCACQ